MPISVSPFYANKEGSKRNSGIGKLFQTIVVSMAKKIESASSIELVTMTTSKVVKGVFDTCKD